MNRAPKRGADVVGDVSGPYGAAAGRYTRSNLQSISRSRAMSLSAFRSKALSTSPSMFRAMPRFPWHFRFQSPSRPGGPKTRTAYCGSNPEAFTSSACNAISCAMVCWNSSGVVGATSMPASRNWALTSSLARIA